VIDLVLVVNQTPLLSHIRERQYECTREPFSEARNKALPSQTLSFISITFFYVVHFHQHYVFFYLYYVMFYHRYATCFCMYCCYFLCNKHDDDDDDIDLK